MKLSSTLRCAAFLHVITLCYALAACTTDEPDTAAESADAGAQEDGPVYALSTLVWGDVDTTGYVVLSDHLDLEDQSLSNARELPGYASIAVADGHLFTTNADAPIIQRYAITDELEWEARDELSLLNEGVRDSGFFNQYMQRDKMAYVEIELGERALWDTADFEVVGSELETQLEPTRDGLDLFLNFNRSYFAFAGPVMRPFAYHDQDWFKWSKDTLIVVYDPQTHAEKSIIEAPCPGLDTITEDEEGNLYFSNWEYSALNPLTGNGAAPCVVRMTQEGEIDEAWETDLTPMTGGRHIMNFRYLRDGKALAAVLHAEKLGEDFDFEAELSDQEAFWDAYALNYRLWMFDLNEGTAEPVTGLPDEDFSPTYALAQLDGRAFIMREANDFSETTIYELTLDGEATRRFTIPGSAYQWLKVR